MSDSTFDSVDPDELPDEAIRCLECGYDLHGIVERRRDVCPECGLPFSTQRLKQRLLKRQDRRSRLIKAGCWILGILVVLVIALLLTVRRLAAAP
ncbi:MAG: hypothetical protein JSV91_01295 [Phycisphaerales bacterium]|nr:MAG: hypothetical protein JSV91_01295 [Phycisphaerales bacterium]